MKTLLFFSVILALFVIIDAKTSCPSGQPERAADLKKKSSSNKYKTCRAVGSSSGGRALCFTDHDVQKNCKKTCDFVKCGKKLKKPKPKPTPTPRPTSDPKQPPTPPPKTDCFPPSVQLRLEDGSRVAMGDATTGMRVQVMTPENTLDYQPIKLWIHADPTQTIEYLDIETATGAKLSLSRGHLLYRSKCEEQTRDLIMASTLNVGDCVLVANSQGSLAVSKVKKITTGQQTGIYAPLTDHGTVVVNDVATSCFVDMEHETVIDYFRAIFQWIPDFLAKPIGKELTPVCRALVDILSHV